MLFLTQWFHFPLSKVFRTISQKRGSECDAKEIEFHNRPNFQLVLCKLARYQIRKVTFLSNHKLFRQNYFHTCPRFGRVDLEAVVEVVDGSCS